MAPRKQSVAQDTQFMLDDLARSGLDARDAELLKLQLDPVPVHGQRVLAYRIPYLTPAGKLSGFYRHRLLAQPSNKGFAALLQDPDKPHKPLRYLQPPGTINELYLPPTTDIPWTELLRNTDIPLVFTEGEKKAAKATKDGIHTIGLGGVWCFTSKRAEDDLLPEFKHIALDGRTVYICFDSDAAQNPDIAAAEVQFARRLVARGARVLVCRIPRGAGRAKQGIDDYLCANTAAHFKRYVLARAFEAHESAMLHQLNEEVLYIRNLDAVYDVARQTEMSPAAFVTSVYANRHVLQHTVTAAGNPTLRKISAAREWLQWEHRAEVDNVVFAPGQPAITDNGDLNRWRGWGCPLATTNTKANIKPWTRLLDAIFDGDDDELARRWFEAWCAYPIQYPGTKLYSAVLMWGVNHGTGKTLIGTTLCKLYGIHSTELKDSDLEDQRFAWADSKQFALCDDITGQNNRKFANRLKTMVTQRRVRVDIKYVKSYEIDDVINYYFTSNDPNALFLEDKDRRFFVHEVQREPFTAAERAEYSQWMRDPDNLAALMQHFQTMDLSWFDPAAPAMVTEAKQEMTHMSKSELGEWIERLRTDPDNTLGTKYTGDLFSVDEIKTIYDPLNDKGITTNAIAREMRRAGFVRPGGKSIVPLPTGRQVRLYVVRNGKEWARRCETAVVVAHYMKNRPNLKPIAKAKPVSPQMPAAVGQVHHLRRGVGGVK